MLQDWTQVNLDPLRWDGDVAQSDVASKENKQVWLCRCSYHLCGGLDLFFCNSTFD